MENSLKITDTSQLKTSTTSTDSDTLKEPFATDIFTLGGNGDESFRQRFGYKGFRYVEASIDRPAVLDENNLTAYFVHSDIPTKGPHTHVQRDHKQALEGILLFLPQQPCRLSYRLPAEKGEEWLDWRHKPPPWT